MMAAAALATMIALAMFSLRGVTCQELSFKEGLQHGGSGNWTATGKLRLTQNDMIVFEPLVKVTMMKEVCSISLKSCVAYGQATSDACYCTQEADDGYGLYISSPDNSVDTDLTVRATVPSRYLFNPLTLSETVGEVLGADQEKESPDVCSNKVKELEESLKVKSLALESLEAKLEEESDIKSQMKALTDDMQKQTLTAVILELLKDNKELKNKLVIQTNLVTYINSSLADASAAVRAIVTDNSKKVDTIHAIVTDNTNKVDAIRTSIIDNTNKVDAIRTSIINNTNKVDAIRTSIINNTNKVDAIRTSIINNTNKVDAIRTSIINNTNKVDALHTPVTDNNKKIGAIYSTVVPPCDVNKSEPRPIVTLSNSMDVVCDVVTDTGGWVVFQRRASADVDFFRNWTEYKHGFGELSGNFWLGLDNIHRLTLNNTYELRVDIVYKGKSYFAHYDSFTVLGEDQNYKLLVSGFSGNAGDSLTIPYNANGMSFTTYDKDNDIYPQNCAKAFHGAWWYQKCHGANLNGLWNSTVYGRGLNWYTTTTHYDSVSFSEMKMRAL